MEIIFIVTSIVKSMAIGLGVGASTLAICSFFVAINDGQIDPSERRMLGVIYVVLRVAMVLILLAALVLVLLTESSLSTLALAEWTMIVLLYVNAFLMTKHIMPSKYGPAIQAASWYSLGALAALATLSLSDFSYGVFFGVYVTVTIVAIIIVNAVMAYQKARKVS